MTERTPKDFAIEFGEYLAKAAERFHEIVSAETAEDLDTLCDASRALDSAIYEFRKRAVRAKVAEAGPSRMIRAFNINDYARVKFSAASLRLWREHAEEMREAFPIMADLFPDDPPIDADGFYRGQLWSIMHLVAPECVGGGQAFEDGCLHLEFEEAEEGDPHG